MQQEADKPNLRTSFTGQENKHAGVEGQGKKAYHCVVLFTLPTWGELLMFKWEQKWFVVPVKRWQQSLVPPRALSVYSR